MMFHITDNGPEKCPHDRIEDCSAHCNRQESPHFHFFSSADKYYRRHVMTTDVKPISLPSTRKSPLKSLSSILFQRRSTPAQAEEQEFSH